MVAIKCLIGQRFGRLVAVERIVDRTPSGRYMARYRCICDCGKEHTPKRDNLVHGHVTSCGCLASEQQSKRQKKEYGLCTRNAVWNYYKRNAVTRDLIWNLTKEQFATIIAQPCAYCGDPGRVTVMKHGDSLLHNGIDRRDNSIGYQFDNCVPCCAVCNRAKGTLTSHDFQAWIEHLIEFRRGA